MSKFSKEMFERRYKHLDLSSEMNAWGQPVYVHPHVESLWNGWHSGWVAATQRALAIMSVDGATPVMLANHD